MRALYVEEEGEQYRLWPIWQVPDLGKIETPTEEIKPGGPQIELNGVLVHAMILPDGERWDANNGFTGKLDDKTMEYLESNLIPELENTND